MTLFEHYGVADSESVPDEQWMTEAARHGWPVLCCDSKHRKRRRPAEREALLRTGVREFVLNGNITATENVDRVLANLDAIVDACQHPGSFVYRVHPTRIAGRSSAPSAETKECADVNLRAISPSARGSVPVIASGRTDSSSAPVVPARSRETLDGSCALF